MSAAKKPDKKPAKSKPKRSKPKAAAKPTLDDYGRRKLAAQPKLPVGRKVVYRGHGIGWTGKTVTVTKHESRGGIFIRLGDKVKVVSPFALIPGASNKEGK